MKDFIETYLRVLSSLMMFVGGFIICLVIINTAFTYNTILGLIALLLFIALIITIIVRI